MNHSLKRQFGVCRRSGNNKGQMAIFVALIFQILFVFFAMTINVALVVHDKINLQNAVDLAAYYGAQRQAEILNAIAHSNYQIRQAWKLLSWRYRVVGTLGLLNPLHPGRDLSNLEEIPFGPAVVPNACITYKPNWNIPGEAENLCNRPNLSIPELPRINVIAGFIGINTALNSLTESLRLRYHSRCDKHGAMNYLYISLILNGYRQDQKNRREIINALADNLSKTDDFIDIYGNPVSAGVGKVLRKNLTWGNDNELDESFTGFDIFNSMSGHDRRLWLPQVQIAPFAFYSDVQAGQGCNEVRKRLDQPPERETAKNYFLTNLNGNRLLPYNLGYLPSEHPEVMTLGVEKNPWYMVYFGVKAQTKPRQLFFPFGDPVTFTARSFAKPFGGRIGPWHGRFWNPTDPMSSGGQIDILLPPRQAGFMNSESDQTRLPNYARFPGDTLGLTSRIALAAINPEAPGPHALNSFRGDYTWYASLYNPMVEGHENDPLVWNWGIDGKPSDHPMESEKSYLREMEIAAVAPDLFDVTYYSIEPRYFANYGRHIRANKLALGIAAQTPVRADLGSHGIKIPEFSIQDQMVNARALHHSSGFYFIRDRAHLLTSWAPGLDLGNFNFPEDFGKCEKHDDNLIEPNPGSCVKGGRTGYSVKNVSREALFESGYQIGGGGSTGAIINPPPADF